MLNTALIDLTKLKTNALAVKSLTKNAKFCAVVKADAYGHGGVEIACALYPLADCFAVALLEEGIALRQGGIDKDILLLIPPFANDIKRVVKYSLTPAVCDINTLFALEKECMAQNKSIKVHLKFNSGMNRLGVDLNGLKQLLQAHKTCKHLVLDGVFSHLRNPQDKYALESQTKEFLLANNLVKGYNRNITAHLSASGGLLQGKLFDMVRVGILLYGYLPFPTKLIKVTPVMKVFAPVVTTRSGVKNNHVLYGNYLCDKNQFDLIRYGYADGLFRQSVAGQINNRCMDLSAVQIGKNKNQLVCVMDNAELLAKKHSTISYEILTSCARRAERKYIY